MMNRIETIVFGLILVSVATPAFATAVPAPVVGVGIGAVLLVGAGYRTLKGIIKR